MNEADIKLLLGQLLEGQKNTSKQIEALFKLHNEQIAPKIHTYGESIRDLKSFQGRLIAAFVAVFTSALAAIIVMWIKR